jgi:hypothetical protein
MHLNKILDQIKHHPSPTEAIDKLGKALEKHEGSLLEKGFQILKSELCANVYEAIIGFSAERVINAVNAGDCNVIKAISDCCCTTQRSIDSVNLNLTQMNADNRLSICQQTNTLQNAITSGFNNLSSENATRFNIIGAKIDAQTQMINDKFCQLEMREMQNKIDALRDEKNALQTSAITQQQTQNIVNQIKPCPVPAYLTCNPYGCNGGFTGYGYGYGYGDSCCA